MTIQVELGVPFFDFFHTKQMAMDFAGDSITLEDICEFLFEKYPEVKTTLESKGYITQEGILKAIYAVDGQIVYGKDTPVREGQSVKILNHMLGG